MQYAYRLLSYRGRSEKELTGRLRMRGFDDASVKEAVVRLKSDGFLEDRKLASSLRRYAEESKHLGSFGTRRFLIDSGIPAVIVDEEIKDIDEMETARKLVDKKISAHPQLTDKMIERLHGLLYRRGYTSETIKKILEELLSIDGDSPRRRKEK